MLPIISEEWLDSYFAVVDQMNASDLVQKYYFSQSSFQFGNYVPVIGQSNIENLLSNFYSSVKRMRHEKVAVLIANDRALFEARVHFVTDKGNDVEIPAASVIDSLEGRVKSFRMYMDTALLNTK